MRHFPARFRKSRMNESRHSRRHTLRESIRQRKLMEAITSDNARDTVKRLENLENDAVDFLCSSIMNLTNDELTILDEELAYFVGRWAVRDTLKGTYEETLEDFVNEVENLFSGSPLDGSPFDADEASAYAEEVWNERE